MDRNRLRHLLALAQHGTHQRAAAAVNLTQPAFSRSLQALEQEVGVTLVERRGRGSALTDAGRLLAERARRMLQEESEAYRALQMLRAGEVGSLRVGVSTGAHLTVSGDFVRALMRDRPRVRVHLVVGDTEWLCHRLHDETLDVVMGDASELLGDPALDTVAFPATRIGLFCRPGHPVLEESPVTFAALRRYPVAALPHAPPLERAVVERLGPEAALRSLVTFVSSDPQLLLGVALDSDAILGANLFLPHRELAAGRLVEIPLPGAEALQFRLALAHLAGRSPSPTLELFRDSVRRSVEEAVAAIAAWEARRAGSRAR